MMSDMYIHIRVKWPTQTRNATVKYEHAPMVQARQVAQANTHLEDEELIEKNSALTLYRN